MTGPEADPSVSLPVTPSPSTRQRPRLLFFAYYFPPANTIGCVRTFNVAKSLTRQGWEVTVVTPRKSVWRKPESVQEMQDTLARLGIR